MISERPYPRRDQATGLALEVPPGAMEPKTLEVVRKMITTECGSSGKGIKRVFPSAWARQGVLLLNVNLMSIQGARDGGDSESDDEDISWKSFVKYLLGLVVETFGNKVPTLAIGQEAQALAEGIIHEDYIVRTHHAVNRNLTGMNYATMPFTTMNMKLTLPEERHLGEEDDEDESDEDEEETPEEVNWVRKNVAWLQQDNDVLSEYFEAA